MSVRLITPDDPTWSLLFKPAAQVTDIPTQVRPYLAGMRDILTRTRAFGLAAPQVGVPYAFFIISLDGRRDIYINPEVSPYPRKLGTEEPSTLEEGDEGCLSFPGQYRRVSRHTSIMVNYTSEKGSLQACRVIDPFAARVIQHEYDHLQGVTLFPDPVAAPLSV